MKTASIKRNTSLDLLRIISMILIIGLHMFYHGGLVKALETTSVYSVLLCFMYSSCMCGVNLFVLISGYFLSGAGSSSFKIVKLVNLFIEVLFYSVVITLVLKFAGLAKVGIGSIINCIFPISTKMYWFITAYFGMYVFSPFINILTSNLTEKQHRVLCAVSVLAFSVWDDITPYTDPLFSSRGFSFVWFVVLYIIAAYVRKYDFRNRINKPFFWWIAISGVLTLSWFLLLIMGKYFAPLANFLGSDYYFRYNSLLVLSSSLLFFVGFLKISINQKHVCRVVSFLSPLTLGVYLIHDNQFMRSVIWHRIFNLQQPASLMFVLKVFTIPFLVYFVCTCVDFIRSIIFKKIPFLGTLRNKQIIQYKEGK